MTEQMDKNAEDVPELSAEWNDESDGLAYREPDLSEPENTSDEADEKQTGVRLREDGEVEFSDDFLGYKDEEHVSSEQSEQPEQPKQSEQSEIPAKYTPDELRQIPFEQWDVNRLDGNVRDYVPIVQEQVQRRQLEQQIAMRPSTPPMFQAPKQYTAKELAEDAQKLACERLGLEDPDDFDVYEVEHQAALRLAMEELASKRNAEVSQYQNVASGYKELQEYTAELLRQSDYMEFDRWFSGKIRDAGVTYEQVNAGLEKYVQQSGGDFRGVQGIISSWYKDFRNEKSKPPKATRPPVLEGTRGSNYEGRSNVDMNKFRDLDAEGQAQALMKMGIV